MIASALFVLSFFGRAPVMELHWLFTGRGRLLLLLVGLGIGFWPHVAAWLKDRLVWVRPVSKRKLKREALQLATDMHAYVLAHPSSTVTSIAGHRETSAQMQAAATEDEKNRIWRGYTDRLVQQSMTEKAQLTQGFGGRLQFVLVEFERIGLLEPHERHLIEWEAGSLGWLGSAATTVEALGRRL
ncbi:MAG TPA: hypothetical protein VK821_00315 [Dehalococcoidia bacterium]|nr:hypothetical protein [Dehalococcoidia bacterium]